MDLKTEFDEQGLIFVSAFRNQSQVGEILQNLDRVIADVVPNLPAEQVFYEDKSDPGTLKQIQLLQKCDDYFGGLMSTGPFRNLAEQVLGSAVVCKNLQYFNKPPGIGLPTPAHQDGYYFKLNPSTAVTMWMALEPVDEENGCVRYVPRSHQRGLRPHGSTGTLGFSQGISDFPDADDEGEIAFPAQPGDLLAHHALTIHRADGNRSRSRTRKALGFIYYGIDAKEDIETWAKYQADLKAELASTDKI